MILPEKSKSATLPYKNAIRSLLYLNMYTHPDIAFAVNYLARFQSDPQNYHWTLVKRVFQYLKGTSTHGLLFASGTPIMTCYTDADFSGNKHNTNWKLTTCFLIYIFGCSGAWCSHLQRTHNRSWIYGPETFSKWNSFLAYLLEEALGINVYPVPIYEDNDTAWKNCLFATSKSQLRHVERRYLKIHEYIRNYKLNIVKIGTKNQQADILTKYLLSQQCRTLCDQV